MKQILIIDDSPIQLRLMKELLKEQYEVMMSTSGMEAVEIVKQQVPDLIFLDYDMPVVDGKMTIKMFRGMEETKETPIVFLTGINEKEDLQAVLAYKPSAYLLKPASKQRIFETIHQLLNDDRIVFLEESDT